MEFGTNVEIWHRTYGHFVLHNLTEIHYAYGKKSEAMGDGDRIAFESNHHSTGIVYFIRDVFEFETTPATEIHEYFSI